MEATQQQLRAFAVLATELNFRRAAEILFISQPALSQSIKQLERTVGVPLLSRSTRHVALTPAGADFAEKVRPALAAIDEAVASARRWADGTNGVLRIGYMIGAGLDRLPKLLRQFSDLYPGIRV
ncbi:MAG: LysR family transcriptional regulator, partial [Actinobacteria bacterium]|nr:LysR family transcriptional regulator [Actinomycetota bacterium]